MHVEELLNPIKWKDKYEVIWCDLCDVYTILCSSCGATSCNCGGCDKCQVDMEDFSSKVKSSVWGYLNESERIIYRRITRLKRLIRESLSRGWREIDWHKMKKGGILSEYEEKLFAQELQQ